MLFRKDRFTTTQMIAGGFFIAIMLGTLLLTLPISAKDGVATPVIDALFTATTSLCVTGLTTVNTLEHWSVFGQIVILFLIQFGGLGVITFTTTILILLGRRITLKERLLIQDAYNLDTLKGLVRLTMKILKWTLIFEGIGAALFSIQLIQDFGFVSGVYKSIFNAVSAFCNAGMDIIGPSSLVPYMDNPLMNLTTMALIILGGIGFPVWWDVARIIRLECREKMSLSRLWAKLQLHSKLVITITACLIFGGMFFTLVWEWDNPDTIGTLSFGNKVLASLFQSVTTRTAGFFTIPQENFTNASSFLYVVLMFIGGSPSGTAGGVKTATIGVLLFAVISIVRGKSDIEVFKRKISDDSLKKALAVVVISFTVLVTSIALLSMTESAMFLDVVYEATSAIGTVGLSRNLTPSLTVLGKLIITITMYLGRIGPITLALAFNTKRGKRNAMHLPEEKLLVG